MIDNLTSRSINFGIGYIARNLSLMLNAQCYTKSDSVIVYFTCPLRPAFERRSGDHVTSTLTIKYVNYSPTRWEIHHRVFTAIDSYVVSPKSYHNLTIDEAIDTAVEIYVRSGNKCITHI